MLLPYLEAKEAHSFWSLDHKYYHAKNEKARKISLPQWICPSQKTRPVDFNAEDRENASGAAGDYAGNIGTFLPLFFDPKADGVITTSSMWESSQGPASEWMKKAWDSDIKLAMIVDGTSQTILAGEKAIPASNVGAFPDDSSLYNGDHIHTFSRAGGADYPIWGPGQECRRRIGCAQFGSCHPESCQFVFLDGSVHVINVSIDAVALERLCGRDDGFSVQLDSR